MMEREEGERWMKRKEGEERREWERGNLRECKRGRRRRRRKRRREKEKKNKGGAERGR